MGGWLIALELKRRGLARGLRGRHRRGGGDRRHHRAPSSGTSRSPRTPERSSPAAAWSGTAASSAARLAVILNGWRLKVPLRWTMQLVAPALPAAYALGRVGCFLVNDDYGRPTDLPWGVKFPQAPAVHRGQHAAALRHPGPGRASIRPRCSRCTRPRSTKRSSCSPRSCVLWPLRKSGRPIGWIFGALPGVRGRRALPDRVPPRQGRPLPRAVHPGPAHQRDPDRDRRSGWC